MSSSLRLPVPAPDLQISLYSRLLSLRGLYLGEALRPAVAAEDFDLAEVDRELSRFVLKPRLNRAAASSLRGELLFPVPYLLRRNPYLLGYYRLLYGFSQKEFYAGGFSKLRAMESDAALRRLRRIMAAPLKIDLAPECGLSAVAAMTYGSPGTDSPPFSSPVVSRRIMAARNRFSFPSRDREGAVSA
jgi:hypothetical protein